MKRHLVWIFPALFALSCTGRNYIADGFLKNIFYSFLFLLAAIVVFMPAATRIKALDKNVFNFLTGRLTE